MKNILLLIIILGVCACSNETELQRSIFISDPDFPELPRYSEWGYNTFGAYYDRQAFISNDADVPLKVIQEDASTSFVFTGHLGQTRELYNYFSLRIVLAEFNPETYDDLMVLHDTTLDLTDQAYEVIFNNRFETDTAEILNGTFQILRAQHLLVDEISQEVILSGVFEFQAIVNEMPVTVSNGRFDVGVGESNFFKY
jgi:hypothetical protein